MANAVGDKPTNGPPPAVVPAVRIIGNVKLEAGTGKCNIIKPFVFVFSFFFRLGFSGAGCQVNHLPAALFGMDRIRHVIYAHTAPIADSKAATDENHRKLQSLAHMHGQDLDFVAFIFDLVNVVIGSGSDVGKSQAVQQSNQSSHIQIPDIARHLQIIEELLKIGFGPLPPGIHAVTESQA